MISAVEKGAAVPAILLHSMLMNVFAQHNFYDWSKAAVREMWPKAGVSLTGTRRQHWGGGGWGAAPRRLGADTMGAPGPGGADT